MKRLVVMSLSLLISGGVYASWQSVIVEQSLDSLAHAFRFSASVEADQKPPEAGALCQVLAHDQVCLTGYVDKTTIKASADGVTLDVSGRSKTADIVDCSSSATFPSGAKLEDIATILCSPYGISIINNTITGKGFENPRIQNDSIFAYLSKLAKRRKCMLVTDSFGKLIITKAGIGHTGVTLTKDNIKEIEKIEDHSRRFSKYVVQGQSLIGQSYVGESTDSQIKRTRIKQESINSHDQESCQDKADWIKRRMIGESEVIRAVVQGVQMTSGKHWQINTILSVSIDEMQITGSYLIAKVKMQASQEGTKSELELKKLEAYQ